MTLPTHIRTAAEAASENARVYEPKYGGKDHSGYDTLMKYEVNDDRQESFIAGVAWLFQHLSGLAPEFDGGVTQAECRKQWDDMPSQDNEGFQPDKMGFFCGFKAGARLQHAQDAPLIAQARAERDGVVADLNRVSEELEAWKEIERYTGRTRREIYGESFKLKRGTYGKPPLPDIPSCDPTDPEYKKIHDELCDALEARAYNEADVCTASVGIWAAIKRCEPWRAERDRYERALEVVEGCNSPTCNCNEIARAALNPDPP